MNQLLTHWTMFPLKNDLKWFVLTSVARFDVFEMKKKGQLSFSKNA
jgi:hypothetical protein